MKKQLIYIEPHPDKVLIKVTKANWNSLFSKYIVTKEGKKVELFTDIEEDEGYENRFKQNVSVGLIIAVGKNLTGIEKGDMAIIDYAVTGNNDALVGFVNGDRIVSIDAVTTYHKEDAPPQMNNRLPYVKGDYDNVSKLLGVVRMGKLIALAPYIFLKHEKASTLSVSSSGLMHEKTPDICKRAVLSASKESVAKEGRKILLKESDLFSRVIDKKELSVIMEQDILTAL